ILAAHAKANGGLDGVVTTVMTNLGFHRAMAALGIDVVQTKVGDRYVLESMLATGYPLGGEQSGHIISTAHATTGDGVLTAVLLLSIMRREQASLADLAGIMQRLPQVLVNVRGVDRDRLATASAVWDAVSRAEAALGTEGRVLVRASGTEPMVRVMVEATTEELAEAHAADLAAVVKAELAPA